MPKYSKQQIEFLQACEDGELPTVQVLVEEVDIEQYSCFYITGLEHAASRGHLGVVDFLISRNVDVNKMSEFKHSSPLHIAATKGYDKIV
ncbi:MAG: ankyrin repeat domain-containing protein [Gammaproteobacteria bacterium]